MRWFWIDRFEEFVRGRRAVAVKNVSLAEEHLHDHFPGMPLMPNSLVVEGMAQTAGLLVADAIEYARRVVLAKVAAAEFHFDAVPGDCIRFEAEVLDLKPTGSLAKVVSTVGDRTQGEAELFFAHLEPGDGVPQLFEPQQLLRWLDQMHMYDVGRDEAGQPLARPDW
ncbi:MAG: 3-hydroxyacyl-ACP dehydratase FabZ family protein [Planctomycetaceae bacterium]|jgi:3-hydroxyacyl-[acyl-carrier-protein] dehydratase|nr:beta-hydroxyacyl-ACP dehydratase [Planctomycetia bacterium]